MAVTAAEGTVLTEVPFLVKRWEGVATATATQVFTHGESYSPDLVWVQLEGASLPADSALSVERDTSATTFTVDCEDNGNDTFTAIAIWFSAGSGGIS